MKGHKISGRCEREKKSKGVKKTGKLRWGEKGRKNRGKGSSGIWSSDISIDTQKEKA